MLGAMRVMPSPAGLLGGYAHRWDASNAATITSSGGLVSALADTGSVGLTLTATTTARPTTGTRTVNSLNTLDFDGSANVLRANYGSNRTVDRTIFCVVQLDSMTGTRAIFDNATSSAFPAVLYTDSGFPNTWVMFGNKTGGTANTTTPHVLAFKYLGAANERLWVDGVSVIDTASTTNNTMDGVTLCGARSGVGGPFLMDGRFCECVVYESNLSDPDRQSVETFLKAKWGTP